MSDDKSKPGGKAVASSDVVMRQRLDSLNEFFRGPTAYIPCTEYGITRKDLSDMDAERIRLRKKLGLPEGY